MHHYYHNVNKTDLAVMREQANARSKTNNKWEVSGKAGESIIHLHKHDAACVGNTHEFYPRQGESLEELQKRFWEAVNEAHELEVAK